jgi:hypothetical protein
VFVSENQGVKRRSACVLMAVLALVGCDDDGDARRPASASSTTISSEATADSRSRCTDPGVFSADVDGDGRSDHVYHLYLQGESRGVVGVCTASGIHDEIEAGAPEANGVMDLQPDGRDEILFGGTTVSAAILSIAVVEDGRLREVEFPGSVSLISGMTQQSEGSWMSESWGCRDVDGDGDREVVTAEFRWSRDGGDWIGRAYRLVGTKAMLVQERRGNVQGPLDTAEPDPEIPEAARSYTGESCQRDP